MVGLVVWFWFGLHMYLNQLCQQGREASLGKPWPNPSSTSHPQHADLHMNSAGPSPLLLLNKPSWSALPARAAKSLSHTSHHPDNGSCVIIVTSGGALVASPSTSTMSPQSRCSPVATAQPRPKTQGRRKQAPCHSHSSSPHLLSPQTLARRTHRY